MGNAHDPKFRTLVGFIARIPAVEVDETPSHGIDSGSTAGGWWVQFALDIEHDLAWYAVQELACVLNYLSLEERLPTVFKPISPPPYMNGGPDEFLSWVIECPNAMSPDKVAEWLESRLPRPVEDEDAWFGEGDDEEEDLEPDDEDEDGPYGSLEDDD